MRRFLTPILSAATLSLFAIGCSGGAEAEKKDPMPSGGTETAEAEGKADEGKSSKAEMAPCTDLANVPADATSCLLDLGQGKDTYWNDSDGVDPGTAGCHYEFTDATCGTNIPDRTFGELCLDDDRLVESNPGKDECHTHGNDMGGPDVVSCSAWCAEQGKASGKCESGIDAEGTYGACQSARCACM